MTDLHQSQSQKRRLPGVKLPAPPATPLPFLTHGDALASGGVFYDVNQKCLDMLVLAARRDRASFALVEELRDMLRNSPPALRERAARRAFLLVDLEFANPDWWCSVVAARSKALRPPSWRGSFPRPSGIQLTRMTLILAWHTLREHRATAAILFGMVPAVTNTLVRLRIDEIDRIAETAYRHVRPRWDDRPSVWRDLLRAAATDDESLMHQVNVHEVQLLAGDLVSFTRGSRPA